MKSKRANPLRSVLCPVDFSDQSRHALRLADAIARKNRASLRVLYVNDPLLAAAATVLRDPALARQAEKELRAYVAETLPASRGIRGRTVSVVVGPTVKSILQVARRIGSDLIVLGTQGMSGLSRLVIGSTTLGVLKKATIPVLVVPPHGSVD